MHEPFASTQGDVIAPQPRGDALAVVGAGGSLSRDELHARAAGIAHAILGRTGGAPPGAVALLLDHDTAAVTAALGVLKAGGHYTALGAGAPPARAAAVLEDAGARVVLTEPRHLEAARRLAARCRRPPAVVDVTDAACAPASDPPVVLAPADRALLVYTSGSTGRPKGVWHDHASVARNARIYAPLVELQPHDRLSLLHGLGTMAAATTLWGALVHGAAVVVGDPRTRSRAGLLAHLGQHGVSGLHLVPTLFRRLAAGGPDPALAALRFVRLGGEAITRADWELWQATCGPATRLHVGLAATETGLVRHAVHARGGERPPAVLPVGDAVPEREVQVVDAAGQPVGPGETGRIVVRGRHLFGGYHGRPEETAAVRSVDAGDGRTVFLSGDLARFDEQGRLLHVGRADAQLQVDGHRVEPAEIEHALRSLPWTLDAAVVARPRAGGGPRLAAFVTARDRTPATPRAVRAHLREHLPPYMVPGTVQTLPELPLLPSGKVDRGALAALPAPAPVAGEPPRGPLEETLLEIFSRVLETPVPGVDADFFLDLGGDSLDAVQVLAELAALSGREPPLDLLARASTVADLARALDGTGWARPAAGSGALVLHADGALPPLFALAGLFGHALRLLLIGRALGEDRPFYGLQPPGMDWDAAGCDTVDAMADHYVHVIRGVQPHGPYHLLGASVGGLLAFEIARRLEAAGERVALLAMIDTGPPDCRVDGVVDRAPRRDWTPQTAPPDPREAQGVRVARQHAAAVGRHVLDAPYGGELVYLACAQSASARADDRRGLWTHFAAGGVRTVPVPGVHGHFHREPQFSAVVDALRSALATPAAA